jgi:dipeptidyl aminopeptidase/acylaminoacyl peptidase
VKKPSPETRLHRVLTVVQSKMGLIVGIEFLECGSERIGKTRPRRLTLSERKELPTAWTPDSKAVIFESVVNGHRQILKQSLEKDTAESVATPAAEAADAHVSPDGKWILYRVFPREGGSSTSAQLMRVPMAGGPPVVTLTGRRDLTLRCAKSPARLCVVAEQTADGKQIVFTGFDPVKGRGSELYRFDMGRNTNSGGDSMWSTPPAVTEIWAHPPYVWDLSPMAPASRCSKSRARKSLSFP